MALDLSTLSHKELSVLMEKAQARQSQLKEERAAETRAKIDALLEKSGHTLTELYPNLGGRGGKAGKARAAVLPKYRDPSDKSKQWSGRGKRPRWFNDAIAAGSTPDLLLIK